MDSEGSGRSGSQASMVSPRRVPPPDRLVEEDQPSTGRVVIPLSAFQAEAECSSSSSEGYSSSSAGSEEGGSEPMGDADEAASCSGEVVLKRKRMPKQKYGPVTLPGYEWVDGEVGSYCSKYFHKGFFVNLHRTVDVTLLDWDHFPYTFVLCRRDDYDLPDFPFLGKDDPKKKDFFYIYDVLFKELQIKMPFDHFMKEVLRVLNVAPSQLHPNGWASMQAFRRLCRELFIKPTAGLFLYFHCIRPKRLIGWVSLIRRADRPLFKPFKETWKGFKAGFFKVIVEKHVGVGHNYDIEGNPLFPFYWTPDPRAFEEYPKYLLSEEELSDLKVLEALPMRIPVKFLIELEKSETPSRDVVVLFAKLGMDALDFRSLKEAQAKKAAARGDVLPDETPLINPMPPPVAQDKIPETRKSKKRKSGHRSGSSRHKHGSSQPDSLPVGYPKTGDSAVIPFFVSKGLLTKDFNPSMMVPSPVYSASGKHVLAETPAKTLWEQYLELNARATAIAQWGVMHSTAELDAVRHDLGNAEKALRETDNLNFQLKKNLKEKDAAHEEELKKEKEEKVKLQGEMKALQERLEKVNLDLVDAVQWKGKYDEVYEGAGKRILEEHAAGFEKAIRQAQYFCQIGEDVPFDIEKDVYEGRLVSLYDLPTAGATTVGGASPSLALETTMYEGEDADREGDDAGN